MITTSASAEKDRQPAPGTRLVTVHGSVSGFAPEIAKGPHRLVADEPVSLGGTDTGPNPYELLPAVLGSFTSMTVALYARRKHSPLESVTIGLSQSKVHAAYHAECKTKVGLLGHTGNLRRSR